MKKILAIVAIIGLSVSCSEAQKCAKPENAGSLECKAVNAVLDCTKGEYPAIVAMMAPIVEQLIKQFMGADGTVDWSHVDLTSLGKDEGTCVLADLLLKSKMSKLAPGEVPATDAYMIALTAHMKAKGVTYTHVHTARGDY